MVTGPALCDNPQPAKLSTCGDFETTTETIETVTCLRCGFKFAAEHVDEGTGNERKWTCPCCSETAPPGYVPIEQWDAAEDRIDALAAEVIVLREQAAGPMSPAARYGHGREDALRDATKALREAGHDEAAHLVEGMRLAAMRRESPPKPAYEHANGCLDPQEACARNGCLMMHEVARDGSLIPMADLAKAEAIQVARTPPAEPNACEEDEQWRRDRGRAIDAWDGGHNGVHVLIDEIRRETIEACAKRAEECCVPGSTTLTPYGRGRKEAADRIRDLRSGGAMIAPVRPADDARRDGMKKTREEMSYAEQVASLLECHGALDGLDLVMQYAPYVHQAEGWGMAPSRCAANVMRRHLGRET